MLKYLAAVGVILLALLLWVRVQAMARAFAARHPEFGPAREEGAGCGAGCGCSHGRCATKPHVVLERDHQEFDR